MQTHKPPPQKRRKKVAKGRSRTWRQKDYPPGGSCALPTTQPCRYSARKSFYRCTIRPSLLLKFFCSTGVYNSPRKHPMTKKERKKKKKKEKNSGRIRTRTRRQKDYPPGCSYAVPTAQPCRHSARKSFYRYAIRPSLLLEKSCSI